MVGGDTDQGENAEIETVGGDTDQGEKIFFQKAQADACVNL